MAREATVPQERSAPKKEGFIAKRISFVWDIISWVIIALLMNILIELLGIFMGWWSIPGAAHSAFMLRQELIWINSDFSHVLGSPADTSVQFSNLVYQWLFVWFGVDYAKSLIAMKAITPIAAYFKAAITIIQLFSVRMVVILFSVPVFIIFALVGFTDGLMVRDLRRFGGDRESSYFWHYIVKMVKPMIITPFVLYLASPWSIHPNWAIMPFAVGLGFSIWLTTAKFKKYF